MKPYTSSIEKYGAILAERDGGWNCFYCGTELVRSRIESQHRLATVDHKIPTKRGGTDDLSNLVLSCWLCNVGKRQQTTDEFKGGQS